MKKFLRFLKEKNVYYSFLKEYKKQAPTRVEWIIEESGYNLTLNHSISDYIDSVCNEDIIMFAFDWSKSEEGHDFWQEVNKSWKVYNKLF